MENPKIAWAIEAATDDYILGCIRFAQRMKYLNSKYPTIILVPDTISDESINQLEISGFKYYIFKYAKQFLKNSLNTSVAIEPLRLEEYDLIYNFEADMIPAVNLDHIIDFKLLKSNKNIFTLGCGTGILAIRPSIDVYNKIKIAFLNTNFITVLEAFLYCDKQNNNEYLKFMDYNYIIPIEFNTEIMHFPGQYKPWTNFTGEFKCKYLNLSEEDYNKFIDSNLSIWILYSRLAEFLHILAGDKTRADFKDLVLICLQQMKDTVNNFKSSS